MLCISDIQEYCKQFYWRNILCTGCWPGDRMWSKSTAYKKHCWWWGEKWWGCGSKSGPSLIHVSRPCSRAVWQGWTAHIQEDFLPWTLGASTDESGQGHWHIRNAGFWWGNWTVTKTGWLWFVWIYGFSISSSFNACTTICVHMLDGALQCAVSMHVYDLVWCCWWWWPTYRKNDAFHWQWLYWWIWQRYIWKQRQWWFW